jgi:hypothetical protein
MILVDLVFLREVAWLFPQPAEGASLDLAALEDALLRLRWGFVEGQGPDSHWHGRLRFNYPGLIRATWVAVRELAWRVGDCPPPEPSLAEGEHACRNALDQLIAWCRKHESAEAKAAPVRQKYSGGEAEAAVRGHLQTHPNATIREVSHATGVPISSISGMPAWQAHLATKSGSFGEKPRAPRHRHLTDRMLAAVGTEHDPSERAERHEASWRRILERATPQERADLHARSPAARLRLIEAELEQQEEMSLAGEAC